MKYYKEKKNVKTSKQLERHFKGIANSKRIDILLLVSANPSITLIEITERLKTNTKTTAEHTRRLVDAGLLNKKYNGHTVEHTISPYGKKIVEIILNF
jgi:DNA-binding MarR family transcriptional regulator